MQSPLSNSIEMFRTPHIRKIVNRQLWSLRFHFRKCIMMHWSWHWSIRRILIRIRELMKSLQDAAASDAVHNSTNIFSTSQSIWPLHTGLRTSIVTLILLHDSARAHPMTSHSSFVWGEDKNAFDGPTCHSRCSDFHRCRAHDYSYCQYARLERHRWGLRINNGRSPAAIAHAKPSTMLRLNSARHMSEPWGNLYWRV